MPQVSIKDQIKKIVELQAIDSQIYQFKRELKEKPLYIDDLKKKFEEKQANLKKLEDHFKTVQVDRKSKELDLQAKEGEITKANSQLSQLKTNKEYQAKLLEIENLKADKSQIEEQILLAYDENDTISAAIAKEKEFLTQEERKYSSEKKLVDDSIREIEDRVKVLQNKRNQITPEVDRATLMRYERILENKSGTAIVPVVKGPSCGGCFMNVPDQVINEIKMYDRLIFCEMCARVLYLEEDL